MFHSCSLVFIRVSLVFTRVHSCSTRVHSCSTRVHSCSTRVPLVFTRVPLVFTRVPLVFTRVPLVFTRVHSCSFVFIRVHSCSFVFRSVWCFRYDHSNDIDKGISNIEIIKASKRLKNAKAVGGDAICNKMINFFVHTRFIDVIRAIFNAIYSKSYFPKLWKVGYIIPIFKSDDSFDPRNYRRITLRSCLGKLCTLVINERLVEFLDAINILSHYQIGFRRGYRTADHVFILDTILNSYFSKENKVYACFVDFSKAYDSVWRNGLL